MNARQSHYLNQQLGDVHPIGDGPPLTPRFCCGGPLVELLSRGASQGLSLKKNESDGKNLTCRDKHNNQTAGMTHKEKLILTTFVLISGILAAWNVAM